jgi:hypothetical protein
MVPSDHLPDNEKGLVLVKWQAPTQYLVYRHPESITIRIFRVAVVLGFWVKKLRAHPPDGAALCMRI